MELLDLFDGAAAGDPAGVDDERDPVDDAATNDLPGQAARLHGAAREAGQGGGGVVGVDGRQRASVAGVEGLEEIRGLGAAHLADDDVVGAVPKRMAHQVADGDSFFAKLAGLEADAVLVSDVELEGVLDRDDAVVEREKLDERVEE